MQQGHFILLQVIFNYNILQFLTYPYVIQSKDTVDYTWWVIFKQHTEMKPKWLNTVNVSDNVVHRLLDKGYKSSKERTTSTTGNSLQSYVCL